MKPDEMFAKKMAAGMGRVHQLKWPGSLTKKITEIAGGLGVEPKAVAGATPYLKQKLKGFDAEFRGAGGDDVLGISEAIFGIAETGSLVLSSSKDTPATVHFVPEFHIVVLDRKKILETSEALWAALRKSGRLPNTLNIISGPSKTGDIEQTLFLGAHGPRELHVILV